MAVLFGDGVNADHGEGRLGEEWGDGKAIAAQYD